MFQWKEKSRLWLLPFFGLIAYGSFREVLNFFFTDVDAFSLIRTGRFESISDLAAIFTSELMLGKMPNAVYYRPIASVFYGILWKCFGLDARGYHAVNLALHALNASLIVVVGRRLLPRAPFSFLLIGGLYFLWHPLQVENVPAIARSADLLATSFILLSLRFLLTGRRFALAILVAWLAIGTKEPAMIVLPLMGACILLLSQASFVKKAAQILVVGGVGIGFLLLRSHVLQGLGGYEPETTRTAMAEFLLRLKYDVMGHVFGLLLAGFSGETYQQVITALKTSLPLSVVLWTSLGSLFVIYVYRRRNEREWWVIASFILWQAMMIHLSFFMFRYLYLTLVPFALLLVFEWTRWMRGNSIVKKIALLPLLLFLTYPAFARGPVVDFSLYERWRESAAMTQDYLAQVEKILAQHEGVKKITLLSIPYQRIYRPRTYFFWDMPQTQVLLEHAVRDYLALKSPARRLEVQGLSYLYVTEPVDQLESRTIRTGEGMDIFVARGAKVIDYPWFKIPGRVTGDDIYRLRKIDDDTRARIELFDPNPGLVLSYGSKGRVEVLKATN